ncbi:MAG TPA: dockerin type I domain-containing protein [Pirellulales bacterium]|jgi:hypothetical protein|nr:dockerin type I domain-containing protein [Pirellulales bacterium]
MKRLFSAVLVVIINVSTATSWGHGFDLAINFAADNITPASLSASDSSDGDYFDKQEAMAAPNDFFYASFDVVGSDMNGLYFPTIHGFVATAGRWPSYTATYSVVSPLYFSNGTSINGNGLGSAMASPAPQGTTLDIFDIYGDDPSYPPFPHPGAQPGDVYVTGSGWSSVPSNTAPFGVSLIDQHELEKDLYIGSGPTFGAYGFAYTVTVHFSDGVTLTTEPLVDIFGLSDPSYGDFYGTVDSKIQDQATFAIYRAIMRGDFNRDGQKSSADITLMLQALTNPSAFQAAYGLSNSEFLAIADVDQNGKVTNTDLQALLNLLLQGGAASTAAVPEPSSAALACIGLIMLFVQRRFARGAVTAL